MNVLKKPRILLITGLILVTMLTACASGGSKTGAGTPGASSTQSSSTVGTSAATGAATTQATGVATSGTQQVPSTGGTASGTGTVVATGQATSVGSATVAATSQATTAATTAATSAAGTPTVSSGTAAVPGTGGLPVFRAQIVPSSARAQAVLLTNVMNYKVVDKDNKPIGTVSDYILNMCEAHIIYMVVNADPSLNLTNGNMLVIPYEVLTVGQGAIEVNQQTLVLPVTVAQVQAAPAVSQKPDLTSQSWETTVRSYWTNIVHLSALSTVCHTATGAGSVSSTPSSMVTGTVMPTTSSSGGVSGSSSATPVSGTPMATTSSGSGVSSTSAATSSSMVSGTPTATMGSLFSGTVSATSSSMTSGTASATSSSSVPSTGSNNVVVKVAYASQVIGMQVVDSLHNPIGVVQQIYLEPESGRIMYVGINLSVTSGAAGSQTGTPMATGSVAATQQATSAGSSMATSSPTSMATQSATTSATSMATQSATSASGTSSVPSTGSGKFVVVPIGAVNLVPASNGQGQVLILLVQTSVLQGAPTFTTLPDASQPGWDAQIISYWSKYVPMTAATEGNPVSSTPNAFMTGTPMTGTSSPSMMGTAMATP